MSLKNYIFGSRAPKTKVETPTAVTANYGSLTLGEPLVPAAPSGSLSQAAPGSVVKKRTEYSGQGAQLAAAAAASRTPAAAAAASRTAAAAAAGRTPAAEPNFEPFSQNAHPAAAAAQPPATLLVRRSSPPASPIPPPPSRHTDFAPAGAVLPLGQIPSRNPTAEEERQDAFAEAAVRAEELKALKASEALRIPPAVQEAANDDEIDEDDNMGDDEDIRLLNQELEELTTDLNRSGSVASANIYTTNPIPLPIIPESDPSPDSPLQPYQQHILNVTKKLAEDSVKNKAKTYKSPTDRIQEGTITLLGKITPYVGSVVKSGLKGGLKFLVNKYKGRGTLKDKIRGVFLIIKRIRQKSLREKLELPESFEAFYDVAITNLNIFYHKYTRLPAKILASAASGSYIQSNDVRLKAKADLGIAIHKMIKQVVKETCYVLYRNGNKDYSIHREIIDMVIPFEKYKSDYNSSIREATEDTFWIGIDEAGAAGAKGSKAAGGAKRKTYRKHKVQKRKYSKRNRQYH